MYFFDVADVDRAVSELRRQLAPEANPQLSAPRRHRSRIAAAPQERATRQLVEIASTALPFVLDRDWYHEVGRGLPQGLEVDEQVFELAAAAGLIEPALVPARVAGGSDASYAVPVPARLVGTLLDEVLRDEPEVTAEAFLDRLAELVPILDGGRYRSSFGAGTARTLDPPLTAALEWLERFGALELLPGDGPGVVLPHGRGSLRTFGRVRRGAIRPSSSSALHRMFVLFATTHRAGAARLEPEAWIDEAANLAELVSHPACRGDLVDARFDRKTLEVVLALRSGVLLRVAIETDRARVDVGSDEEFPEPCGLELLDPAAYLAQQDGVFVGSTPEELFPAELVPALRLAYGLRAAEVRWLLAAVRSSRDRPVACVVGEGAAASWRRVGR